MEIKKALTFRASSIGDCLMGKYLLDQVHATFPHARLGLVVASRGGMIRDLLAASPYIEVIEANRTSPMALWRLWRQWRQSDLVVTQYTGKRGGRFSILSKLMARLLSRRGGLVGFSDASTFNAYIYDKLVPMRYDAAPAALEREALMAVGIRAAAAPVLEHVGAPARSEPYVVVHMFAGNRGRGISPATQRALLEALRAQLPLTLMVSGDKSNALEARQAAEGLAHTEVIAGEKSLQDLAGLIAGSAGVVSVDTGVAHMAVQLGKPVVVLASCLGLHWWQPEQYKNVPQIFTRPEPGGHVYKDYPDCLNTIDASDVAAAAKRFT